MEILHEFYFWKYTHCCNLFHYWFSKYWVNWPHNTECGTHSVCWHWIHDDISLLFMNSYCTYDAIDCHYFFLVLLLPCKITSLALVQLILLLVLNIQIWNQIVIEPFFIIYLIWTRVWVSGACKCASKCRIQLISMSRTLGTNHLGSGTWILFCHSPLSMVLFC